MKCVELFAGAGGLAMGVHLAGFKPQAIVEWDKWACDTIKENQNNGYPIVANWNVQEGDVRTFDWEGLKTEIDLIAGGPPCQPFSMGGKHQAHDDSRDMFPATVDIVRKLRPRAFIIENVKGLTRSSFANYYQYILLQLSYPEVNKKKNEDWVEHFSRLQKEKSSDGTNCNSLTYNVVPTLINAADYGVPQKRERVFIVGFRSDLKIEWSFPKATHSFDSLLFDQWVSGDYWRRHGIASPTMPVNLTNRINRIKKNHHDSNSLPWRTIRDVIADLPDPQSKSAQNYPNHRFQSGAKIYPGHTGSPIDLPAKTLKAGAHGVPGGENMLVHENGSVRYFTIREAARIQTFPDGYLFHGSWSETMRQLGNAVPVMLGKIVAASVAERLILAKMQELSMQSKGRGVA
ncbi:DNA cytosine methyltransferase [Shewanella sp. 1180_01]|uniref:DNA cytosine methyltransferase n=1 Tax=Shewanella sp. 1180_01 TaxID=2604451 RepID=UPI0040629606